MALERGGVAGFVFELEVAGAGGEVVGAVVACCDLPASLFV